MRRRHMENAIKYYYNMNPKRLDKCDSGILFEDNGELYYLELAHYNDKRIKDVYELNKIMISNNILVHEIILNTFKQIVTIIDEKGYILMRINVNLDKKIDLKDIAYFQYLSRFLVSNKMSKSSSWGEKWSKKIDYYEQQAIEIGKKYPVAMEAFSYFVGIAENAILYINNLGNENPSMTYCHIRPNMNPLDFYNPFNLILDYKVRDLSEYIKLKFFYDKLDFKELNEYILNNNLTGIDIQYFYARMLFPTYYFDIFERVMDGTCDEIKLSYIVKNMNEYEKFLNNLYKYLSKFARLEEIDWLKKAINQY